MIAALQTADAHVARLAGHLTDEQFNWRPDARGWSVGQCLNHLVRSNDHYSAAMRAALDAARGRAQPYRPVRPGWLARWFLARLEPPVRVRVKAPRHLAPEDSAPLDRTAVLTAFAAARQPMRALIHEIAAVDPNGTRFANPFIRGIDWTLGSGLLIVAAHERRHLWQADQVVARPGFPDSRT